MRRLSCVLLLLTPCLPAIADRPQVASAPVGVKCEVAVGAITKPWKDRTASEKRLAIEAIRILSEDPQFFFWRFVGDDRPEHIYIRFEQRPAHHLIATISVRRKTTVLDALEAIPILGPDDLTKTGWPTDEKDVAKLLSSHVLNVANRNGLWLKLKDAVAVGEHGSWNSKPPVFAAPIKWNDRFKTYFSVLRAGAAVDSRIVYAQSLDYGTSVNDGKEKMNVLVARAQCVYTNDGVMKAGEVADLAVFQLRPVYLHKKAQTNLQPASIDCTLPGLVSQ